MIKEKLPIIFLAVLGCSLILAGCDRSKKEREEAIAEAAEARANFAKAQVVLAKTEKEKNILKSELAAAIEARAKLHEKVSELAKGRDGAVAKAKIAEEQVENLTGQLKEQMEKFSKLQEQNKKLQATIEELQDKLKDIEAPTVPQL